MLSEIGNVLAPSQPIKNSEVNQASQANSPQSLRQALSECMLKDRFRLEANSWCRKNQRYFS